MGSIPEHYVDDVIKIPTYGPFLGTHQIAKLECANRRESKNRI
jgi:hypothetical protein